MQAQQLNLNVISNNIANVNTTGYKKNKIEFQDLLYQNPRQSGGQTVQEMLFLPELKWVMVQKLFPPQKFSLKANLLKPRENGCGH